MPFIGSIHAGEYRQVGSMAGLERTFNIAAPGSERGYPLRTLGMKGLQVIVTQSGGSELALIRVRINLTNIVDIATDVGWHVISQTFVTALNVPEVIVIEPIVAHHAQVVVSTTSGTASGTYVIGAAS